MASRIKEVEKFISDSRREFHDDYQLDKIDREEAQADWAFLNSSDASKSQWNPDTHKMRTDTGRPVLQYNVLPIYVQHVTNAGRQNKPEIKISAGDEGTEETAEFYENRIRQIIYECKGDIARDTARDQQVGSGRASIRVYIDTVPGTDRQRIVIERIVNQFSVIYGPGNKYDRSDCDRIWIITYITKAEHKRRFGEKSLLNRQDFAGFTDVAEWVNIGENEMVQIAEKFVKEYDDPNDPDSDWTVCRYIMNGVEILQEDEAPTNDIGVVPQWGREAVVEGVQRHFSLINPSKDWQRSLNLYGSNIAENIAKQPKNRYMAPFGSVPKHMEDAWSGNAPKGLLYYLQWDPETGRAFEKPEPDRTEPPIQALSVGLQQAIEGIKASMGIFDASLGQRSNETTGVAIERRKVEGETATYHFPDNEARTWNRVGEIIIKMIDEVDGADQKSTKLRSAIQVISNVLGSKIGNWLLQMADRVAPSKQKRVPIRYENGKSAMVPIGSPFKHPRTGKVVTINLDHTSVAVHVEQGPSYANAIEQKQEAEQAIITAAPELMLSELGVNWIRNSGRPGADEDAEALTRYINYKNPGLIQSKDGPPPIPPEAQQQIQMLTKKLQTTDAFAQSLHQQLQEKQPELMLKKYTVDQQEETKRVLGLIKVNSEEAQAKLEHELQITHNKFDRLHDVVMKMMDQKHATDQQGQAQGFQAQQSDADRQAALATQAQGEDDA